MDDDGYIDVDVGGVEFSIDGGALVIGSGWRRKW